MAEPMDHDLNEYDSLMRFDDHVLQIIVQHLDAKTLSHVANVCKRLRSIAEHTFRRHHHTLDIPKDYGRSTFHRILCKFGHLIKSIDVYAIPFDNPKQMTFNEIIKNCIQLQTLCVRDGLVNCELAAPFLGQLIELHLIRCKYVGNAHSMFQQCTNLKTFKILDSESQSDHIVISFRKLEKLSLYKYLSVERLRTLFALNPQLKTLEMNYLPNHPFVSIIVENLKELETLKLYGVKEPGGQFTRGLLRLSALQKLNSLVIYFDQMGLYRTLSPQIVDAFCSKIIAIEHLELYNFVIKMNDITNILKLNRLKVLSLHEIRKGTEFDWIQLVTHLPLLSKLSLHFIDCSTGFNTIDALMTMAFGASQLTYLKLYGVQNLNIEQQQFEMILNAVQRRDNNTKFTIEIAGCRSNTTFNVPESVQRTASKYLKINYQHCIFCTYPEA